MADDPTKTVRIQRDSRVAQDSRGRNVWVGRVEEASGLEFVSTAALEKILAGGDRGAQVEIRKLAESGKDGLLARDSATGHYKIVDTEAMRRASELSLVSTMMLRKVIGADGTAGYAGGSAEKPGDPRRSGRDRFGGFDPYNKS
ncbi:MAG TPA: hypothetical protein VFR29_11195 [Steroidobacteraceae bacterium]|nr:hypothetical protein [Steroidobacteraceae bacterium]